MMVSQHIIQHSNTRKEVVEACVDLWAASSSTSTHPTSGAMIRGVLSKPVAAPKQTRVSKCVVQTRYCDLRPIIHMARDHRLRGAKQNTLRHAHGWQQNADGMLTFCSKNAKSTPMPIFCGTA